MHRLHVIINGKVTGVFFRKYIKEKAQHLGLTGFVRNTEEGKVEAVFEGSKAVIDKMIEFCYQGPKMVLVENLRVIEEKPTRKYKSFDIIL